MIVRAADGRVLLTLAHDEDEFWATSTMASLTTVGEVRQALSELTVWAEVDFVSCGIAGYKTSLDQWIAHALHGMQKLSDEDLLSAVPSKVEQAWDEISSYAYNVYRLTDLTFPPHTENVWAPE